MTSNAVREPASLAPEASARPPGGPRRPPRPVAGVGRRVLRQNGIVTGSPLLLRVLAGRSGRPWTRRGILWT